MRGRWKELLTLAVGAAAVPVAVGLFGLLRSSGAVRPECGDRPGSHYPACALPPPFGTATVPVTVPFGAGAGR